jgi:outer membrane protein
MKRFPLAILSLFLSTACMAAESTGIVNFGTCITDSKLGQHEQASFESLKKQMAALLEETEKNLGELTAKFNDPDYLDGLSPEAEQEMKERFRTLNEEMSRYQNQYYQVMNQANMRIIQTLTQAISDASQIVSKEKKLSFVLNKDACYFYAPATEITSLVIAEMDKAFASVPQEGAK